MPRWVALPVISFIIMSSWYTTEKCWSINICATFQRWSSMVRAWLRCKAGNPIVLKFDSATIVAALTKRITSSGKYQQNSMPSNFVTINVDFSENILRWFDALSIERTRNVIFTIKLPDQRTLKDSMYSLFKLFQYAFSRRIVRWLRFSLHFQLDKKFQCLEKR